MTFDKWFVAQFGKPPSPHKKLYKLREACAAAGHAYWSAELALREREEYEARRDAAVKAWRACEVTK
jgi:hypothetical protein